MLTLFKVYDEKEFKRAFHALESFGFRFTNSKYTSAEYLFWLRQSEIKGYREFIVVNYKNKLVHCYRSKKDYLYMHSSNTSKQVSIMKSLDEYLLSNRCPRMILGM